MKFANYSVFSRDSRQKGVEYAIEHTLKVGYDAVEIIDHLNVETRIYKTKEDILNLKRLLDANNLPVACYSLPVNLIDSNIDNVMYQTFTHIENAAELGSPFFHHTIVSGYDYKNMLPFDEVFEKVSRNVERIAKKCNEYGMVCLYEPQGVYFNGTAQLKKILDEMKSAGCDVGICGDLGNSLFVDTPPTDIYKAFANDIKHIHIKDYTVTDTEPQSPPYQRTLGNKYIKDAAVGDGCVDFKYCFSCVPEYDSFYSMEINCSDEEMLRSIDFIKNCLSNLG